MKKRIARKIISQIWYFINWDTDRQPYTIPQQRKAHKVFHGTKFNLMVYSPTKK